MSSLVINISRQDISELAPLPHVLVADVKHLAFYNWIEAPTPTIAVPGLPPSWRGVNIPRQLKKDNGLVYIAQNAACRPENPTEPLYRALYVENRKLCLSDWRAPSTMDILLHLPACRVLVCQPCNASLDCLSSFFRAALAYTWDKAGGTNGFHIAAVIGVAVSPMLAAPMTTFRVKLAYAEAFFHESQSA
jgi:hypothetical protein